MRHAIPALVLGACLGAAAMYFVHQPSSQPTQIITPEPSAPEPQAARQAGRDEPDWMAEAEDDIWGEDDAANDEELAALHNENETLRAQVAGLLEWIKENIPTGGAPPPPSLVKPAEGSLLDENGHLPDELALALSLDAQQVAQINTFFDIAQEELEQVRTNKTNMHQTRDDRLYVRVSAFKKAGTKTRNKLYDNLQSVMGVEAFSRLMESAGEQLERDFFYFGQARQSISFKAYADPDTGQQMIRIVDRYHIPQEKGRKTIEVHSGSYTSLPPAYSELVEWTF